MSEETIFREVDEELRSERMRSMWRRFGPFVIGAAVLIVILVAVNEGWRWYQDSVAATSSEQFYQAYDLTQSGDIAGAQEALEQVIADGSGAYPTLARFSQAALMAQEGQTEEALAAYDRLATEQSNPHLRDLALLFAAGLLVDRGDVEGVRSRVGGLISEDNVLRNPARELLGLAQYAAGDAAAARATFAEVLNDPEVSLELRQRVSLFDAQLQAEGAPAPATEDGGAAGNAAGEAAAGE